MTDAEAVDTSMWTTLSSPVSRVRAPANLGLRPDLARAPDSDQTFLATAGAMVDDVPVSTILTHRPRSLHLRTEVQRTSEALDEVTDEGEMDVVGADLARWVRGHWVLEEALTPEGHELVTRVVVPVRREFVSLVVRVPRGSDDGRRISDAVVTSLRIVPGGA